MTRHDPSPAPPANRAETPLDRLQAAFLPRLAAILLACTLIRGAHAATCGTVVYQGKKTNISCRVALPGGKKPSKPAQPAAAPATTTGNATAQPALLNNSPAAAAKPAAPAYGTGYCTRTGTFNGRKIKVRQHCPLLPLSPLATPNVREPSGDFKTRQTQHKQLINQLAAKYQIDPALVHAVISVESGYQSNARSHAGAIGMMQLMPGTASELNVADPYDPARNIEGGIKYLSQQLQRYQNTELALAAYNAGPQSILRYGGQIPPYNETRAYVKRVMHYKERYQNDWQQHIK
ncbi:lytic transglycosylase domain-containing protein [uncultured Cardiobacterium sp.]|uniref:lytic transglycosylase domain-containing protein n=1 Tax=uncultured Cardiobacterium sp. TaxID=417619 RepID=UPI002612DA13|nr:lytic transglycosylase domain-containing protein [uncultured Cardiobacterium sp.]